MGDIRYEGEHEHKPGIRKCDACNEWRPRTDEWFAVFPTTPRGPIDLDHTCRRCRTRELFGPGTRVMIHSYARHYPDDPHAGIVVELQTFDGQTGPIARAQVICDDGTERAYSVPADLTPADGAEHKPPPWIAALALVRMADTGGKLVLAYDPVQIPSERWWAEVHLAPTASGMVAPTPSMAVERAIAERDRVMAYTAGMTPAQANRAILDEAEANANADPAWIEGAHLTSVSFVEDTPGNRAAGAQPIDPANITVVDADE